MMSRNAGLMNAARASLLNECLPLASCSSTTPPLVSLQEQALPPLTAGLAIRPKPLPPLTPGYATPALPNATFSPTAPTPENVTSSLPRR